MSSFDIHMIIFYASIIISLLVIGVLFYALIRFRRQKGRKIQHFHRNLGAEILWTTIPLIILIALAIPAIMLLMNLNAKHSQTKQSTQIQQPIKPELQKKQDVKK